MVLNMNNLLYTLVIGIGATVVMDIWGVTRNVFLGGKAPDYAMVGRWLGHMTRGRFKHDAIAQSLPVRGERAIGWTAHYLTGIAFAAILTIFWDSHWVEAPSLAPALAIGIGTVIAPFFLMQPGMGAGIAASKTPNPGSARLQSLITHGVFGLGLYLSGWAAHLLINR